MGSSWTDIWVDACPGMERLKSSGCVESLSEDLHRERAAMLHASWKISAFYPFKTLTDVVVDPLINQVQLFSGFILFQSWNPQILLAFFDYLDSPFFWILFAFLNHCFQSPGQATLWWGGQWWETSARAQEVDWFVRILVKWREIHGLKIQDYGTPSVWQAGQG